MFSITDKVYTTFAKKSIFFYNFTYGKGDILLIIWLQ